MEFLDKDEEVLKYESTRYLKPDQWLVNVREMKIVKRLIGLIDLKGKYLLDVPCGYGRFSSLFIDGGVVYFAGDVKGPMVARSRRRLGERSGSGRFAVFDICHIPFKTGAVDCTFTIRLLHHNFTRDERREILNELSRVTKRFAIVSFYRYNFLHRLSRKLRRLGPQVVFGKDEFEEEYREAGFSVVCSFKVLPLIHAHVFAVLEKQTL